jgi:hypothetical protein
MATVRLRALVLVVMALALAACTSSVSPTTTTVPKPLPAIDLSATPTGWVPVAYGDAQVSVPASLYVYYPGWTDCGLRGNALYLGPTTPSAIGCGAPSANPRVTTRVFLRHIDGDPTPYRSEKPVNLNGVAVYEVPSYGPEPVLDYYAPSIGVEVLATGPLARRIANTLARSPRAVALASGPAPAVPSSWHQVTFAGLRFSIPADWPIYRTQLTPGLNVCRTPGVAFLSTILTLSTDVRPLHFPCALSAPTAEQPENGVQVDSGLRTEPMLTLSFSKHCLALNGLTACPATLPAYSILVLKVTVPGRSKPVFVSIGLAANGIVARTILYSLRAYSTIGHPLQTAGTIAGTLVRVGGPAPGATVLPGQVTARNSVGRKFTMTVGKSGKFVLSVPPGVYKLTGHSPLVRQETCMATKPVRVKMGQGIRGVEVICSIS